jgi:farnesyl-diphosphate farnesyltransferase
LEKLRAAIQGSAPASDFGELARQQGAPAEKQLLERCAESLAQLQTLSPEDLKLVRAVLNTITSGQELDLTRFAGASDKNVIALQNEGELEDYTYRVAGCVGEFWTKMCRAHLFPDAPLDDAKFLSDGIGFGKGLQLVNILRDIPADLQKGRCYLPTDRLQVLGLTPRDLLNPANEKSLRPLYNKYLNLAEAHLTGGWNYTKTVPRNQARVRLACAWPVLIGIKTIGRLRTGNVLDPTARIKISRGEVRGIIFSTIARYPFRSAWESLGPEH